MTNDHLHPIFQAAVAPLYDPISILERRDTRGMLLRSLDSARADFIAEVAERLENGANIAEEDDELLRRMALNVLGFVRQMQRDVRELQASTEGLPASQTSLMTEITRVLCEHYRFGASAAGLFDAAVEAA